MKKILLLLFTLGFLFSCYNNNLSNTYWVAVESNPIPNNKGNGIYDGLSVHFTKNKLILGDVYHNKGSADFNLKINDKDIYLNDTLWAEIFAKYQDSLILDIRENARVKFVKLNKEHSLVEKREIWKHKNWILFYDEYPRELYLTDLLLFDEPGSKLCIQKDLIKNQFISTVDKWRNVNINGNQLFVKTFYQRDYEIYRIKSYEDSIIKLESLKFPEVKAELRKKQYISESQKLEIFNQIKNFTWNIKEICELDTISRGSRDYDVPRIKLESMKNKKISFKFFHDSTYQIFESNFIVENGNWRISPTGKEIILNTGLNPTDYIDLIYSSSDSLIIGSLRTFEPKEDKYGMDIEMYYKIKLTNNGG